MRAHGWFTGLLWVCFLALTACGGPGENSPPASPRPASSETQEKKPGPEGIPSSPGRASISGPSTTFSWPPGWTVVSQGCALSGDPEVLWMEILAPGVGPEEAVRHALSIITPRGQAGGGIDVVPAPDGRTATGQVADRSFKAVASAQRSEKGTHLHITLQQSAGSP